LPAEDLLRNVIKPAAGVNGPGFYCLPGKKQPVQTFVVLLPGVYDAQAFPAISDCSTGLMDAGCRESGCTRRRPHETLLVAGSSKRLPDCKDTRKAGRGTHLLLIGES